MQVVKILAASIKKKEIPRTKVPCSFLLYQEKKKPIGNQFQSPLQWGTTVRHLHAVSLETPSYAVQYTPRHTRERLRCHHWQRTNSSLCQRPLELACGSGGARARVPGGRFGAEVVPEIGVVEKEFRVGVSRYGSA
eukprot:1158537-Pelagomonas_calceolata.AAC.14